MKFERGSPCPYGVGLPVKGLEKLGCLCNFKEIWKNAGSPWKVIVVLFVLTIPSA